jgi:hypothetical protein
VDFGALKLSLNAMVQPDCQVFLRASTKAWCRSSECASIGSVIHAIQAPFVGFRALHLDRRAIVIMPESQVLGSLCLRPELFRCPLLWGEEDGHDGTGRRSGYGIGHWYCLLWHLK